MSRTTTKIVIARSDGAIMGQYVLGLGEHIIGREIDSAIYIDDPHVSRSHARLIITEDAVEIEDLGSTSGTFLDEGTGSQKWEFKTGARIHSSPVISPDETLYIGSGDGKVYAIATSSKGLAKSPWPMFGGNAQHTGRVK